MKKASKKSKKAQRLSRSRAQRDLENRITALEAAVEDLKYWRAFRDRED